MVYLALRTSPHVSAHIRADSISEAYARLIVGQAKWTRAQTNQIGWQPGQDLALALNRDGWAATPCAMHGLWGLFRRVGDA